MAVEAAGGPRPRHCPGCRDRSLAAFAAIRRSGDPAIPDDLTRIIELEIRKELRGLEREHLLPADVESDDGKRLVAQAGRDRSKPVLCPGLAALARTGHRQNEFLRLIRQGSALLVGDVAFGKRGRGRRCKLDPAWLFRRAYLEGRACGAIAAETACPVRRVAEMLRRLSDRLQRLLLVALALPPDVVVAITKKAPLGERVREQVLEALRAFVAKEAPPDGDWASP